MAIELEELNAWAPPGGPFQRIETLGGGLLNWVARAYGSAGTAVIKRFGTFAAAAPGITLELSRFDIEASALSQIPPLLADANANVTTPQLIARHEEQHTLVLEDLRDSLPLEHWVSDNGSEDALT
ncbi:MAG: hypothetical protein AAF658_04155, partial [Myxococcota bacterium]